MERCCDKIVKRSERERKPERVGAKEKSEKDLEN